jgi:hypothetical protein
MLAQRVCRRDPLPRRLDRICGRGPQLAWGQESAPLARRAADVSRELDLIAGSGEALVAISYVRKEGSVVSAATGASDASAGSGLRVGSSRSNGASASER